MLKLTHRYAAALLEFAEERGLEEIYRQALTMVLSSADLDAAPKAIGEFLAAMPGGREEKLSVLYKFLDMARERMDLLACEIISAVPLAPDQLARLEKKLILMFRKQLDITQTVDPSLLGGLRVIAGNIVLDDSIKRKMRDMQTQIYEGVYFKG